MTLSNHAGFVDGFCANRELFRVLDAANAAATVDDLGLYVFFIIVKFDNSL